MLGFLYPARSPTSHTFVLVWHFIYISFSCQSLVLEVGFATPQQKCIVITVWSHCDHKKDVITLWSQIYFVIMIRSKCDHRSITTIWCDHNCDHNYILWSQYTLWFSCDLVVITTFDVFYSRNHKSLLWSQITVVITTLTCQNHKSLFTGLLHIIYYQN